MSPFGQIARRKGKWHLPAKNYGRPRHRRPRLPHPIALHLSGMLRLAVLNGRDGRTSRPTSSITENRKSRKNTGWLKIRTLRVTSEGGRRGLVLLAERSTRRTRPPTFPHPRSILQCTGPIGPRLFSRNWYSAEREEEKPALRSRCTTVSRIRELGPPPDDIGSGPVTASSRGLGIGRKRINRRRALQCEEKKRMEPPSPTPETRKRGFPSRGFFSFFSSAFFCLLSPTCAMSGVSARFPFYSVLGVFSLRLCFRSLLPDVVFSTA